MSDILQVGKGVDRVDDITNMQYHTYTPYTTAFNNNDEIRIAIQSQDLHVLPSESYVLVEFKVTRRDTKQVSDDDFRLTSNATHFFSEMRYELNGVEIDRCKSPGVTSHLKTLLACKSSDDGCFRAMQLSGNRKLTTTAVRMIIPLKFVFGFCDDYEKVLVNSKHELILVRNRTDLNAIIATTDVLKFDIQKVHWKIPHVALSDHAKLNMLRVVDRREQIPLSFRSWDLYEYPNIPQTTRNIWSVKTTTQLSKPRYVVVAFQTNRNHNVKANSTFFDHCSVTNLRLFLNNVRYPYDDTHMNVAEGEFSETMNILNQIQNGYYNNTQHTNPNNLLATIGNQVFLYPFDCSRSDESMKNGMVDVRIEIDALKNFPPDTTAYCLIIHDNMIQYSPATGIVTRDI